MKLELEEFDIKNETHRQLIEGNFPVISGPHKYELRVFLLKQTGEYIIFDFRYSPEVLWIEYMYLLNTNTFFYLVEELLKNLRIKSVRYMMSPDNKPPKDQLKRIVNTLIDHKFKFLDGDLSTSDSFVCYEKIISKRFTGSATTVFDIPEEVEC